MRLKVGKIINSLKKCNLTCCKHTNNQSLIGSSNNDLKNNTFNGKKKNSICKNIRLIYYTFFYNESNDGLTAIETCLSPFIDCVSNFIRYLSWVITNLDIIFYNNYIFFKKYLDFSYFCMDINNKLHGFILHCDITSIIPNYYMV
jgi:hypothetical protein